MLPYYPFQEDNQGHKYEISSWWERLVSKYTGLTILEVDELDYIAYLQYRRDAFIYFLNQTENGQEYLDNAYRLEQTEPDREGLRKHFGRKEEAHDR